MPKMGVAPKKVTSGFTPIGVSATPSTEHPKRHVINASESKYHVIQP